MTTWGASNNGAWKLGYNFVVVADTPTYTDIRAEAYIWTKYATWEGSNNLTVSGSWSFTGSTYDFSLTTNSAWSSNNIAKIWQEQKRFNKTYGGYGISINVSLTGVNYPNVNYRESVSGSYAIAAKPYDKPAPVTNVVATRISDYSIRLDWVNTNPSSSTAPYTKINIDGREAGNGTLFGITAIPVGQTYTWNGALPDRSYDFIIYGANDNNSATGTVSNVVNTTPSAPSNMVVTNAKPTGAGNPRQVELTLAWDQPSGRQYVVDNYRLAWSGGAKTTTGRSTTIVVDSGKTYNFALTAENNGDGNDLLSSRVATLAYAAPGVINTTISGIKYTSAITGASSPKTSTVFLEWTAVSGATGYIVRYEGVDYPTTGTSAQIAGVSGKKTFTIFPTNAYGTGAGTPFVVSVPGVPNSPSITKFAPSAGGLDVEISAGNPNGSNISYHEYRLTTTSGSEVIPWTRTPGTSFTVSGVPSGQVYILYVRSVNGVGESAAAMARSDEKGGRIGVWDGSKIVYVRVRTANGIASVYTYDGSAWVLTPN